MKVGNKHYGLIWLDDAKQTLQFIDQRRTSHLHGLSDTTPRWNTGQQSGV